MFVDKKVVADIPEELVKKCRFPEKSYEFRNHEFMKNP
jgi:hypothetical protein